MARLFSSRVAILILKSIEIIFNVLIFYRKRTFLKLKMTANKTQKQSKVSLMIVFILKICKIVLILQRETATKPRIHVIISIDKDQNN